MLPGVVLQTNMMNTITTRGNLTHPPDRPTSRLITAGNLLNRSLGLVGIENHEYPLTANSAAIDAGTDVGILFKGSAPDISIFGFSEQDGNSPLRPTELRTH